MNKLTKRYAMRAFIWCVIFYATLIFNIFYLVDKAIIKNANIIFVFIPLIILAISSESMSRNPNVRSIVFKPYSVLDFILKIGGYAISVYVYRGLTKSTLFYLGMAAIILFFVISLIFEIRMYIASLKTKT